MWMAHRGTLSGAPADTSICHGPARPLSNEFAVQAANATPSSILSRNIFSCTGLSQRNWQQWRTKMKLCFAVIATAALLGTALPAVAEEVGVGVGPVGVGVTAGEGHSDHDIVREREVIRDDHRDRGTVIIHKGDHDRDVDHDR